MQTPSTAYCLLLVASLVATVLAGCGGEVTPIEPVTITFCFPDSRDQSLYQPIAEAFQESHPHITINLRPDPSGQWVRDESREVDAFVWWSDPSLIEGDTPLVLSLDPLLAKTPELLLDDFYPRSLDMFRWEETLSLWALPAEVDMQLLYYNKDLFDERGVAYPQAGWTWDDLLLTAQRLTTVEGESWNYTGHFGLASHPTWGDIVPFIYQHGGELFQFDDPLTEEAIQWYADLALVHSVMPRPKDMTPGNTYDVFQQEKAAMWIGYLGWRNGRASSMGMGAPWGFNWGVVPLPGDQSEATMYWGQGYYITSRTAHVEEAWAWIQYLSEQPTGRALPARQSVAEVSGFRELVGEQVAAAALYAVEHLVPPITAGDVTPETLEMYTQLVESVVNGELTAAEAMATLRGE